MMLLSLIYRRSAGVRFLAAALCGCVGATHAVAVQLVATTGSGRLAQTFAVSVNGQEIDTWKSDDKGRPLLFRPSGLPAGFAAGVSYIEIAYLDVGYGKIEVQVTRGGKSVHPDRFLGLARADTGRIVTARMRVPASQAPVTVKDDFLVRIGMEDTRDGPLSICKITLDDKPFDDPHFAYVITDPWNGPYSGPAVRPADNTTLKGKIMVGYQGWFRTPNDPEGRGWVHWGDIRQGHFTTDMWPDVTQYPPDVLEKADDVKTRSGSTGYLFSSAWPEVADLHFRWMREHQINGAFLQRFVSHHFHSINGGPEWVLAGVRAAANREGRIWAVEYDVSGCPDDQLLGILKTDWSWLVDDFGLLKDPNYAHEGGKPVVFIWGMPFPDRKIYLGTANAVVDFFKNDPKYGGNYVIGGIPGNWRGMSEGWQEHFKKYDAVQPWMSQTYAEDVADFGKMGLTYYGHVKPGFSWANLKHLPTGDTEAFTPRDGGRYYWNLLSKAAQAGVSRLFVGMFDEYDELTAIMPMSDDPPPTPVRPGVGATFYHGERAAENGTFKLLPSAEIALGTDAPAPGVAPQDFLARMGGQITFPGPGSYTFSIEGAQGDRATLNVGGTKILDVKDLDGTAVAPWPFGVAARERVEFHLEYHHGSANGTLRLLWESAEMSRQPVPPEAFEDAWGRFLTNEERPVNWWLTLTTLGKEMMAGRLAPGSPMPQSN